MSGRSSASMGGSGVQGASRERKLGEARASKAKVSAIQESVNALLQCTISLLWVEFAQTNEQSTTRWRSGFAVHIGLVFSHMCVIVIANTSECSMSTQICLSYQPTQ